MPGMEGGPNRSFTDEDLRDARFVRCDLSGAELRGVEVAGTRIESPYLLSGPGLLVNGIDVGPYVDAELDERFPGRVLRDAEDPPGLRAAWAAVERTWLATIERAAALPAGAVDESVDGEWSFAETLRHLVMATDTWLGRAILGAPDPYHPIGVPHSEFGAEGRDASVFSHRTPTYTEVLAVRGGRIVAVREYLERVTEEELEEERRNPWDESVPETVTSCLHVIMNEEWEHHRYAVRDLEVLERRLRD